MQERISESELVVMDVVWARAPVTAGQVADALAGNRDWSLQTIKTLLARLVGKGALATQQDGRRFLYRPLVAQEAYRARESRRFVDRLFGGRVSPLVAQLAEQEALSDADIAELRAIIDRLGQ